MYSSGTDLLHTDGWCSLFRGTQHVTGRATRHGRNLTPKLKQPGAQGPVDGSRVAAATAAGWRRGSTSSYLCPFDHLDAHNCCLGEGTRRIQSQTDHELINHGHVIEMSAGKHLHKQRELTVPGYAPSFLCSLRWAQPSCLLCRHTYVVMTISLRKVP